MYLLLIWVRKPWYQQAPACRKYRWLYYIATLNYRCFNTEGYIPPSSLISVFFLISPQISNIFRLFSSFFWVIRDRNFPGIISGMIFVNSRAKSFLIFYEDHFFFSYRERYLVPLLKSISEMQLENVAFLLTGLSILNADQHISLGLSFFAGLGFY